MRDVVVWGNCQAEPLAQLLRAPLAGAGLTVVPVPPVFLVDEAGLARVREVVAGAAVLVTQPVRDEYRLPGCGADQLAALLPDGARVVRVPVTFHTGPFPFHVNGHGADGARIDSPLVTYHDLRLVAAAARGDGVEAVLAGWPGPDDAATVAAVRELDAASVAELRRRETALDVRASHRVGGPDAMFTLNHPTNAVLADLAEQVLTVLGVDAPVEVPERQFLGEVRAPVDPVVAAALGWTPRDAWVVGGRPLDLRELVTAHLDFYATRPDVVADALDRHAPRLASLGLRGG